MPVNTTYLCCIVNSRSSTKCHQREYTRSYAHKYTFFSGMRISFLIRPGSEDGKSRTIGEEKQSD